MIEKKFRLKKAEVEYLLKKGEEERSKLFIIRFKQSEEANSQYATVISRKISIKAVERNKIKRHIFESIRTATQPTSSLKIVLIPKKQIMKATFEEIQEDIMSILKKLS